jgi:hypothetical protein
VAGRSRVDGHGMHERYAVVFRAGSAQAAGGLEVEPDRLLLRGRGKSGDLELDVPFSDLSAVRIGRRPSERLNGYRTLVLDRTPGPAIYVAPLGLVSLNEIADLLNSLGGLAAEDVLAISVPLKPGCHDHASSLLALGPPIDPASLGLTSHDVYLLDDEAIFVFRGSDVRVHVHRAFHHPAVWRSGLEWRRCFAGPPQVIDPGTLDPDAVATYRWEAHEDDGVVP